MHALLLTATVAATEPPRFPFGAYSDPPYGCLFKPSGTECGGRTDYKDLPEKEVIHGMNYFTPYLSEASEHNESTYAAIDAYLVRAEALGVQVSYALNHLCSTASEKGCGAAQRELIKREVLRMANYSAIASWYLVDEPDGSHIDVDDVAVASALIRSLDPRPVALVLDQSTSGSPLELRYAMSADVLMADPYPIGRCEGTGGCPDNVSEVSAATMAVVSLAEKATKADGRPRSVTMVPQAFGSLGSSWGRNPTRQEGRVMVYLMLLHGAKGILL
jgi:hypothetical protein